MLRAAVCLAVMAVLSLAGCGNTLPSGSPGDPDDTTSYATGSAGHIGKDDSGADSPGWSGAADDGSAGSGGADDSSAGFGGADDSSAGSGGADGRTGSGGYVYITRGAVIEMDAPAAATLASLGEPLAYFEAASCAFGEQDKIWTYKGYRIDTYQLGGVDYFMDVVLLDDTVLTSEGIRIGDDTAAMRAAYGEPSESGSGYAIYKKDDMKLLFLLDGETITTIEYLSRLLE